MSPCLVHEFRSLFASSGLTEDLIRDFRHEVMEFYTIKGRHSLEWRHTVDPYRIVVSEVMLQQTQVPRVSLIYPQFIEKFPNFFSLATAPQVQLLSAWQGLGYNRRALNLQKLAVTIMKEFDGVLPEDSNVLAKLPGIGPATSCSIAAFAFNHPVIFIETNIRRVFIHYFFSDTAIVDDRDLFPLVEACLLPNRSREWYWALMDLGTSLKTSVSNPNRRSRQYVRQSRFSGSDRQIRGALLRLLLSESVSDSETLAKTIKVPLDRVVCILDEMCREGFFVQEANDRYRIL
ncbi:MAG TPA: A/G-specific adenine glycosylase [Methanocorpusculum sp.]|nr:A/G-specific adenine glycosylase [Methanocorpusculum sp.]